MIAPCVLPFPSFFVSLTMYSQRSHCGYKACNEATHVTNLPGEIASQKKACVVSSRKLASGFAWTLHLVGLHAWTVILAQKLPTWTVCLGAAAGYSPCALAAFPFLNRAA